MHPKFYANRILPRECTGHSKHPLPTTPKILCTQNSMLIEFCQENALVIANTVFQQHKKRLYTWNHQMVDTKIRSIIFFVAKDGEALYSQQKKDWELTVAQIMNSLLPNSDLN